MLVWVTIAKNYSAHLFSIIPSYLKKMYSINLRFIPNQQAVSTSLALKVHPSTLFQSLSPSAAHYPTQQNSHQHLGTPSVTLQEITG